MALTLALGLFLTACGDSGDTAQTGNSQPPVSTPPTSASVEPTSAVSSNPVTPTNTPDVTAQPTNPQPPETKPPEPLPIVGLMPEGEAVEEEWFADAAFVGDSRTDGLKLYSGIKGASFYSYKGLSVFNILSSECIALGEEKVTAIEALSREQYKKVYIMLGINEIGYPSVDSFRNGYSELVAAVKECQPEADIYLQLQPPVNEDLAKKAGLSSYITNERVKLFNDAITAVSEEHETALVNVWESLADEEGGMPAELTSDGVHMKGQGYKTWYAYLRSHTGTTPLVEKEPETEPENPDPQPSGGSEEPVQSANPGVSEKSDPDDEKKNEEPAPTASK